MPLIEGLGDEVTLIMATLLVCVVVTLAWFSTFTADLPALREVGITVIERTQIRRRIVAQPVSDNQRPAHSENHQSVAPEESQGRESGTESTQDAGASATTAAEGGDVPQPDVPPLETNSVKEETTETRSVSSLLQSSELEPSPNSSSSELKSTKDADSVLGGMTTSSLATDAVASAENISEPIVTQSVEQPTEEEVRRRRVQFFQNSSSSPPAGNVAASDVSSTSTAIKGDAESSKPEASISPSASPASIQSSSNSQPKPIQINNAETESVASSAPQSSQAQEARQSSQSSPSIRVKLKYMNETQRLVYTNPLATIGNFRRTHFQQELEEGDKWVRFIYNGQDLRDDEATLQAYQVGDNCTMHCLITNKRRAQTGQGSVSGSAGGLGAGDDEESDSMMGALMYPLFTLVLAVVWYFRLTYRQYFSPMSTVCLIGISFLLGLGYFSSVRTTAAAAAGNQQQQPQPQSAGTSNQSEQRRNQRAATTTGHVHAD